jgi:general secretion pathway protein L
LNIGHTGTDVLVLNDGALIAARNVDWGGKNIADALTARYGLNYIQAMREVQTKGAIILDKSNGNKEQLAFSQTIEESLQGFVGELRLMLLELQSELNLHWSKGLVTGGVSGLKNLNGYLTQNLQIAFNRYRQFENHPAVNFNFTPHLDAVTGVAVGLAIEGIRRPRNPATNFLKGDLTKKAHFFEAVWERWGYAAQLMGAAFVAFLIYAMARDSLSLSLLDESEKALKTQAQAVASIPARQASASRIRKFITAQEQKEKGRKQAEKVLKINSALDVAELISSSLPSKAQTKLEVKRLSIQNDQAEVQGYVPTEYDKDTVAKALQKAAVGAVSPVEARIATPAGKVPFAFKFRVLRQGGG